MFTILSAMILSLATTQPARADHLPAHRLWPLVGFCSEAYRFDSYGMGLISGFKQSDERARLGDWRDEGCYILGQRRGAELLAFSQSQESDSSYCNEDWESGRVEGLKSSPNSAGRPCFIAAYQAGVALLRVSARSGNTDVAGTECVSEYQRGYAAGKARDSGFPPAYQPMQACYYCGYDDGVLFPIPAQKK